MRYGLALALVGATLLGLLPIESFGEVRGQQEPVIVTNVGAATPVQIGGVP